MDVVIKRFEVWLVTLDPTVGHEMQKQRPCEIISTDEMNQWAGTAIIAPLTSTIRDLQFRVKTKFDGKNGEIAVDHLRSVDKSRLTKKVGQIDKTTEVQLTAKLIAMFAN